MDSHHAYALPGLPLSTRRAATDEPLMPVCKYGYLPTALLHIMVAHRSLIPLPCTHRQTLPASRDTPLHLNRQQSRPV